MQSKLQEIIDIATRDLRACYAKDGIIAGTHHFTDYWGRDGFFASSGSLAIGDLDIVEKMINLFYEHQRVDGLIPYRIMRGPTSINKYFGRPSYYRYPRPTYRLRGLANEVLDGTTLTLLYTALLGLKSGRNLKKFSPQIKRALNYLLYREKKGLLFDGVMAEWNDIALKWGNLLYSNIIYWYMYDRLSNWTKFFDINWHKDLDMKKNTIAQALRDKLWNGSYFADWFDYKRQDYFYPFGNCLSIIWGLTTKKESLSILRQCRRVEMNFTLESNHPKYPWWRIDFTQRFLGMSDYQNQGILWWQPGLTYLSALNKMGKQKEAANLVKKITNKVLIDQTIYECYDRDSIPVKRLLYSSEKPFAWGSGMMLWVLYEYLKPKTTSDSKNKHKYLGPIKSI